MLLILFSLLAFLIVAFAAGLYVSVSLGVTALSLGWIFSDRPIWDILSYVPWNVTTTVTLVALPLFILMGEMLLRSGVTEGMYGTLSKWLNTLPGGLWHTNVVASGVFACISGSSAATAATIGSVAVPYLQSRGYSDRVTLGSLAAGGTLGILIPPSIVMIVYGVLVEESIGQLYIAGIIPGLLMLVVFMGVIFVIAKARPHLVPPPERVAWRARLLGLLSLAPIVALIFLVLGTIYLGVATATEAAAFGVTGAFAFALLNGRVSRAMLRETFLATAGTTSMIMLILIGAFLLQFTISFLGLPNAMSRWVISLELSPMQLVLAICALFLVMGMFMESLSMIIVTVPVLLPMVNAVGIDLVWFGIVVVILVEMALITPPVGLNLFILQSISERAGSRRTATTDVYMGALPFWIAILIVLGLILAFPEISLWLPNQAYAR